MAFVDPFVAAEPTPPASEVERWTHTRMRRRILYGLWRDDLRERVRAELRSQERSDAWGEPDLTANLLGPTCKALSSLYTPEAPRVTGESLVLDAVAAGGLWDLMIRGQRDTIGMREWLIRVDAVPDEEAPLGYALAYRPAFADRVVCTPRRDALDLPLSVREAVFLDIEERPAWYWEVWDAGRARHAIERLDGTVILEEMEEAYPYRDEFGVPVVPYSLYHAERTGVLWDPWEWLELVEACFRVGVLWTFYGHLIRNASWPQRYMAGAWVSHDTGTDEEGQPSRQRTRVAADPALVLHLTIDPEAVGQPLIGQWAPASDPQSVAESIDKYERRAANLAGLDPASMQKVSGDPRSGYAIAVSQTAADANRLRFTPSFRRGDLETIRISAAVLGSAAGIQLPGRGYTIEYGPEPAVEVSNGGRGDGSPFPIDESGGGAGDAAGGTGDGEGDVEDGTGGSDGS